MADSKEKEGDEIRDERPILIGTVVAGNNDDIKKLIECPVCFEIPLAPIYLCREGHIVCNSCQCRTALCPLCRGEYSNTRSFFAEEMIQRCSLKCRYADQGCPVFLKGNQISSHQLNCGFRPYKCIVCNGKPIDYSDYQDHVENVHHSSGKSSGHAFIMLSLDMTKMFYEHRIYDWPQYYIKYKGNFFVFRVFATNAYMNAWLCLVGQKADCAKFEVKISLKLPSSVSGNTRVNWLGAVRHFRETPAEDIYLGGGCLSVPINMVRNSYQYEALAEWIYLVQVREKKSEGDEVTEGTEFEARNPRSAELGQVFFSSGNDNGPSTSTSGITSTSTSSASKSTMTSSSSSSSSLNLD